RPQRLEPRVKEGGVGFLNLWVKALSIRGRARPDVGRERPRSGGAKCTILSSLAEDQPARRWPRACRKIQTAGCSCWRLGLATGIRTSICRLGSIRPRKAL